MPVGDQSGRGSFPDGGPSASMNKDSINQFKLKN